MTDIVTLEHLAGAYATVFRAPGSDLVLRDLIEFCHAAISTFTRDDARQIYIHEGRRQVFLRMNEFITLSVDELITLRAGRPRIISEGMESEDR